MPELSSQSVGAIGASVEPEASPQVLWAAELAHGDDLPAQVRSLAERSLWILRQAEAVDDSRTALTAILACRSNTEFLVKMPARAAQIPKYERPPESMSSVVAVDIQPTAPDHFLVFRSVA
jgi:hypothetical protein